MSGDHTRPPGAAGDMLGGMSDWQELGDGVFTKRYASLDMEIGAVVCGDGVLVIDTRAHHGQARDLIVDLREITKHQVRWVLDTHHHWDHTFGNGIFAPRAAIWGHTRCADALIEHGEAMRAQVKQWAPDLADAFDEVDITPPEHTFSTSVTLSLNDRVVEFHHLGRGHTDNDAIAVVPDAGVVFAGDLIEEGAPPAFQDSYPLEWPGTLAGVLTKVSGAVVPGHGAVVDAAFVSTQHEQITEVARLARSRHENGATIEQAVSEGGPFPDKTLEVAFARAWLLMGDK